MHTLVADLVAVGGEVEEPPQTPMAMASERVFIPMASICFEAAPQGLKGHAAEALRSSKRLHAAINSIILGGGTPTTPGR
mmetsp:Transcript_36562/g.82805  ORF Transcript_36562/g.82805 Transcript_36562/m.82805 type:complete len:80 (-) Transcript_36562:576-815(-)